MAPRTLHRPSSGVPDPLVKPARVQEVLGISYPTFKRWAELRLIPTVRVGIGLRMRQRDLAALAESGVSLIPKAK